ncbi:MAG: efflux RND transporter periplasmic adaptor subunit [Methylococcaceae bacterium]|nr:MAG: efflux RND transporter periplasmic adaptor subunit [Methylococcaceae bacterium]
MSKTWLPMLIALGLGAVAGYYWAPGLEPAQTTSTAVEKKPLYYRHPMNPAVTSPTPAKDEMGMDYTPVYAEDNNAADAPGTLSISPDKVQKLGVTTAPAQRRELARTVRAVGVVEADERRLYEITLKFDGYIEKLHVNATGQPVKKGQPLFELYSPELLAAQREYLIARQGHVLLAEGEAGAQARMAGLAQASLERLRNWGIAPAELAALEKRSAVLHALTVRAPADGVVMQKDVVAGQKAMAGDTLFHIADLSQVWLIAQVYEQEIGLIAPGQTALVTLDAYPGRAFQGEVDFIYPALDAATRTVKVRLQLANPDGLLKPMMYAQVELAAQPRQALAIPLAAVLDSGRRSVVLVARGDGRYEPRPVRLGLKGEEAVEVLQGLTEGEAVVVGAQFLIDAESNLKGALAAFGENPSGATPQQEQEEEHGQRLDAPHVGHSPQHEGGTAHE